MSNYQKDINVEFGRKRSNSTCRYLNMDLMGNSHMHMHSWGKYAELESYGLIAVAGQSRGLFLSIIREGNTTGPTADEDFTEIQ